MGYGKRAIELLVQYYEGKIPSLSEDAVAAASKARKCVVCVVWWCGVCESESESERVRERERERKRERERER